ncbi:putative serine/threonine-protein kinase-like protein CCR3 [Acorus calamus]|uniref:Serine/threonine-protein kinase-like protein CCR3 n=1 Tax=Acorus calamus TaxID=4465 RepID=A0AAV9CBX4_ACOCL|nr:putative serine/threonine-protein kinase-like protein CCR3 [Acorus calamus]
MPPNPAAASASLLLLLLLFSSADALGSASTLAVVSGTNTVCGISAGNSSQTISCSPGGSTPILPAVPFDSLSGGRNFFCGVRSGGLSLLCWSSTTYAPKRIYNANSSSSAAVGLRDPAVGDDHVCAIENTGSGVVHCWRGQAGLFPSVVRSGTFRSITSGRGFSCGVTISNNSVKCWGGEIGGSIEREFANVSVSELVAGDSHVCGVDRLSGLIICKGNNESGQSNAPSAPAFELSRLALGANHSCALRRSNGTVVCWGGRFRFNIALNETSFESIVSGANRVCGVVTANLSVICWDVSNAVFLPLPKIIPGECVSNASSCGGCGIFPDSQSLCTGSRFICQRCDEAPPPSPPSPSSPSSSHRKPSKALVAFAIVGSVGAALGLCSIVYCLWTGVCAQKKIHNSVQPTIAAPASAATSDQAMPPIGGSPSNSRSRSRSSIFHRQSSRAMRRQRSGTSHPDRVAEEFTFAELAKATENFSPENRIGAGSFGTVYKGKLEDGREVAIKRGERTTKRLQEKENAFQSELAFLSRLHHKHLVGLVGFCEEEEERLLVYEYMKNGALYNHLHNSNGKLESWKTRIRVCLDAARGIEYLHNYAVPPIIHRDIKSSNILLDSNWTARVSDFGLSLEGENLSMKAAGTVGYMDPEYYGLHHLTAKSDVYGFGVVLLEVLTGRRAIFKEGEAGAMSLVDYAVPRIGEGEVGRVLDPRVGPPGPSEAEAVELVAYVALHCVSLEGKDRPSMADVVANLERAMSLCEDSHGSISSNISLGSD